MIWLWVLTWTGVCSLVSCAAGGMFQVSSHQPCFCQSGLHEISWLCYREEKCTNILYDVLWWCSGVIQRSSICCMLMDLKSSSTVNGRNLIRPCKTSEQDFFLIVHVHLFLDCLCRFLRNFIAASGFQEVFFILLERVGANPKDLTKLHYFDVKQTYFQLTLLESKITNS